jgi:hypothetical protein
MATNAPDGLTPAQEQALLCLLNEPTVKSAAEKAGVGERTLHRWLDDPAFDAAYRKARRQVFSQAVSLSQKYAALAVNCLGKMINDPSAPHSAKVQASQAMLKFSRESIELDDLAQRVATIEARQEKKA